MVWLTVKDKKEEKSVPSSYLESLANTLSKMTTNWIKEKRLLQKCNSTIKDNLLRCFAHWPAFILVTLCVSMIGYGHCPVQSSRWQYAQSWFANTHTKKRNPLASLVRLHLFKSLQLGATLHWCIESTWACTLSTAFILGKDFTFPLSQSVLLASRGPFPSTRTVPETTFSQISACRVCERCLVLFTLIKWTWLWGQACSDP